MIRRIVNMIKIGRVRLIDDTDVVQRMQIDEGPIGPSSGVRRLLDKVISVKHFGFVSSPPLGSEVIVIRQGGHGSLPIVVATNHQPSRHRNLEPGDAGIHDVRGAYVLLLPAGPVIDAAGGDVTIQNARNISVTGTGTVTVHAPHVTVESDDVNLGASGGPAVARIGDDVDLATGKIISGSSKVKAA